MRKKVAYVLAGVFVAVLLVAGIATAVYADDGPTRGGGALLDRVAQILNIDKQKLADAFKQAQSELAAQRLADLVKDGKLTQQQADELKAWQAKRPADPRANPQQFQDWLKARPNIQFPKPSMDEMLARLVKDGKLTQQQADQYKAWMAKKPANAKPDSQEFKDWLKARPDIPLPKPGAPFHRGMGMPRWPAPAR